MSEIVRHVLAVLPEFALACLALAVLPGPATALFLHRAVRDGRRIPVMPEQARGVLVPERDMTAARAPVKSGVEFRRVTG